MNRLSLVAAAALSLAYLLPAEGQSPPGAADLPLTQVTLFSSGVGYYQREGQVEGHAHVDLSFPAEEINDLLKSLSLQDLGGGQIRAVSYDNRNPLDMTLKSFALDLTANPSLADLLNQARGENVELLTAPDAKGAAGASETVAGVIVGVERQKQAVGKEVVEHAQLNVLTSEGLRGLPLAQVQRVRFLRPALEKEFRKALEVLATGHDKQKKLVSLNFAGSGRRSVRVGYVTESPIWKTSYRLGLDKGKAFLQGWAVVENTTDEDWTNVRLALVSGRPLSFRMDLYQPLFVTRPLVEPELFASLRPPVYGGDLQEKAKRADQEARDKDGKGEVKAGLAGDRKKSLAAGARAPEAAAALRSLKEAEGGRLNFRQGVASVAAATELGEYFQYAIEQPVSLPRQKSALLPVVHQDVSGSKVSIYNEQVHPKFPLRGLRFKNDTPLHLMQGPITVFEDGGYAGDARLPDLQPGETRLLSYAVDLGVEVAPQAKVQETLQGAKVVKGILYATHRVRESKTYAIKNRTPEARTLLIEHPYRSQFQLVSPAKASERTRDVYRFEVAATSETPVQLEVVEELPRVQTVVLTNSDDETVRFFLRAPAVSEKVKQALTEALALKAKVSTTRQAVQKEEQALKVIEQDQARMRANMERVPPTSEAYKRYLKKFDEQETEIERRRAKITELQEVAEKERKAYDEFLAGLSVE